MVGENTTLMVQVAGETKFAPHDPPVAALANGPVKARALKKNVPLPVAVTVTGCDALVVPSVVEPNVSEVGETLTVRAAEPVPVPESATGEPVTGTLAVMVAVPLAAPVAVGVNTTLMVQVVAAARVATQVPPAAPAGLENGAVTTTAMVVAPAVPVLLSVSVLAALVVPTLMEPKANGPPVTLRVAVAVPVPNSTAPGSKVVSPAASGLLLPKKSVAGTRP